MGEVLDAPIRKVYKDLDFIFTITRLGWVVGNEVYRDQQGPQRAPPHPGHLLSAREFNAVLTSVRSRRNQRH